jgi:RHS repeat-associated protein
MMWRESYTYDRNGNRASKATPWGVIKYVYDAENRLIRKGDVVYINDKDGNTLSEKGLRYEAAYQYNGQNRMVNSVVTSHVEKTHVVNNYAYDALGRRTITENVTGQTLRTLYDGKGFEAIREGETFRDGSFTTRYAPGEAASNAQSNLATGERYRWVGENESAKTRNPDDGYTIQSSRYNGRGVTLYGNGEAVAVSYSSSGGSRSMYMGKDLMGSVRSVTADTGTLEGRYEYDAFGQPYKGDLTGGMNLGYTGKPYDSATGLYNYGYRDYKPQAARFTTIDPIRDGNNWFAYVNNDPVNWKDLWGLQSMYTEAGGGGRIIDSSTNVSNLIAVQQMTREAEIYQMGGAGRFEENATITSTYCNLATFDIAEATGFNTSTLYNGTNRNNVNANQAASNLAVAATNGTIVQIGGAQAQVLANVGYTVIAAWVNPNLEEKGHLATVSPNGYGSTTTMISNVGSDNGIKSVLEAFGKNNTPQYYYDPNQTFTFNTSNILQTNAKPKKSD